MFYKEKGFTLIEIVVAIVLLGTIAVYIFPLFNLTFNSINSAGNKTKATYDAQKLLVNNDGVPEVKNLIIDGITVQTEMRKIEVDFNNKKDKVILDYYKYLNTTP